MMRSPGAGEQSKLEESNEDLENVPSFEDEPWTVLKQDGKPGESNEDLENALPLSEEWILPDQLEDSDSEKENAEIHQKLGELKVNDPREDIELFQTLRELNAQIELRNQSSKGLLFAFAIHVEPPPFLSQAASSSPGVPEQSQQCFSSKAKLTGRR